VRAGVRHGAGGVEEGLGLPHDHVIRRPAFTQRLADFQGATGPAGVQHQKLSGPDTSLYFVVGVDAFLGMSGWRQARELFSLARVIVTARPGWRLDEVERLLTPEQRKILGNPIFHYLKISDIDPERLERKFEPRQVLLVEVVSLDIASREIRQLVEQGRSIRHLVPDTVAAYMAKNRLYQRARPGRSRA